MTEDGISSFLRAIPLPSLLIAHDERILGANDLALSLLGTQIVGRHFITALRQPAMLDAIEGTLRDGNRRTTRYLGSEGSQDTSFVVTVSKVETDSGAGALLCFEDVTHLEQAGQMRRDFVANVSHELRTPLTALMGFIETLQGPAKDDAAATARFLGFMQSEAHRMERLVRDLLSLSRVEAEERVRPMDRVDLGKCIGSVLHSLRAVSDSAGVRIDLQQPETPVIVPGDFDLLTQVATNLIENAVKYGAQGKVVHVTLETTPHATELRGPAAILTVRDEGPGFDPLHIPRLTERFYRVDTHRSREMGGTGLGLAIVKHIVNRHRGRLRIASEPGKGAEFKVILPAGGRPG
ncbi:two-component system phosphate regulon sensor histidine kinase PhoR [Roseovarius halotolerans]|uniref:histidine kinase n=1 Tax=Roseovarius halotolerans TaxID=505353 RepID=A0A1X6YMR0_9RHOB|nr:ATP-binding protein [Roseovarius halotolerans]RKT34248.1 two-component system phosphate regulon sensor histidine kinase PhoR [Roseovarius halotolerans]SLN25590.1 Alkaline phosphatase synthesis sensor protein PhoR [Roseovarius halotolerans]